MLRRHFLGCAVSAGCLLLGGIAPLTQAEELATTAAAQEHPLAPAIRWAKDVKINIDTNVKDYTCTMVKRERIDDKVSEPQYILTKIRHQPFSVYMRFISPENVKDQEAIYVDGLNDGNLLGHAGSGLRAKIGMVSLKPNSPLAMKDNRYPITDAGVQNLTKRLIEVAENDAQFGECEVKFFKGAKINGSTATCIQVTHPTPRKQFLFNMARIFIDDEKNLPVRYEAYYWPREKGGAPELLEEYTYLDMKLNVGLTDADFDHRNPGYKFH